MNSAMRTLYACMLSKDISLTHIYTTDPDFFLRIDFYDETGTSIGFYERENKIGVRAFSRSSPYRMF